MGFIDDVRADRADLARVLKKHKGIRRTVEELYPDSAHFIYELLQNAEDTGASEVVFVLNKKALSFEHNGRPFGEGDIWGITDIGEGTKSSDNDKIGKFGVGFKAVFSYSETPHIWSPTFAFKISDLVLPSSIPMRSEIGKNTRFEFPFNNPKKPSSVAYSEVKESLTKLAETTLLFLTHLESISWQIGNKSTEVFRISHSKHHIEVLTQTDGKTTTSSHYLRFSGTVKGMKQQHVSIAYELEFLPKVNKFSSKKALSKQLKIAPANPGRVSVFFPAEKETSGLRFHLHAPFVPELSRASIKESPVNNPLFEQLAEMSAKSLHLIRDIGLLTGDFLSVLPNSHDTLPERYEIIREAIIEEMNNKPLTPTHAKKHVPAKQLLQAKASLKGLLTADDLEFLVDYDDEPPLWAIGASQKNSNQDLFLSGLAVTDWDINKFIYLLIEKADGSDPDDDFLEWLTSKPDEWHQQMYSILYKELELENEFYPIDDLIIIRLSNGSYSIGNNCYFSGNGVEHDDTLPRVAKGVYSSGKNKSQQERARKFLEEIGVREVGEAEEVAVILKQRYTSDVEDFDKKTYQKDLKRFISLVEKDPKNISVFADYLIFECADGLWRSPKSVFLDEPYMKTGLSTYYEALGEDAKRVPLSQIYFNTIIEKNGFMKFARAVGVQDKLKLIKVRCNSNSLWDSFLSKAPGGRRIDYGIDCDYYFPLLHKVIGLKNQAISQLIWNTMCDDSVGKLEAVYRKNGTSEERRAPSLILNWLTIKEWIPQTNGNFVCPYNASRELLPKGFPFDEGYKWLQAIDFGKDIHQQSEEQRKNQAAAKDLGFKDQQSLEDGKWFAGLSKKKRQQMKEDHDYQQSFALPENEPRNPEHRAKRVGEQAADAPGRNIEKRTRSVSVGSEEVKQEAKHYLRQQYTNADGEMICQVCKEALPFKLDDGNYYIESVEFFSDLKNRHYQNYLSLCPNHSAMFRHANGARDLITEMFIDMEGSELDVVLAQEDETIYFTQTHINDLKTIVETEGNGSNEEW